MGFREKIPELLAGPQEENGEIIIRCNFLTAEDGVGMGEGAAGGGGKSRVGTRDREPKEHLTAPLQVQMA